MQQIADWLEKLGLGQYAPRFAENDINFAILCDLTDQDLKELGVSSLGHRRQLLRAIAELNNTVEKARQSLLLRRRRPLPRNRMMPPSAASSRSCLRPRGSTALSARLDPEDMREIVGAYHRSCAEQIAKAGGFVAKYMGDGVLAYFGYPQAHEHDAERAVLAGLALVEAVPMLKTAAGTPLQCASASPLGSSWSVTSLDRERRRNVASSATRRTWRRACKDWPSRTWS